MENRPTYLFLAEGFEEIEALATVDILRRGGMSVVTVAVADDFTVVGAHGIEVEADAMIDDIGDEFPAEAEWYILPGGLPGATNLHESAQLNTMLKSAPAQGTKIAAICASPAVVLAPTGLLDGLRATCYPGFESQIKGVEMTGERVVDAGEIVTANGPGSTFDFALTILAKSRGEEKAAEVAGGMLVTR